MVQRSPSRLQTGTFYWGHVCYPYCITSLALTDVDDESTRSYVLLIKQLLLWAALIYALEGNSKHTSFFEILIVLGGIHRSTS